MSSFIVRKLDSIKQKTITTIDGLFSKDEWAEMPNHPWRRFFARMLDLLISSVLMYDILEAIFVFLFPIQTEISLSIIEFFESLIGSFLELMAVAFCATILNALTSSFTGWTIGKWLFGIKILDAENYKPSIKSAFKREMTLYVIGLGLGIPIISLFTFATSYFYLEKKGKTIWDKNGNFIVLYHNLNFKQLVLNIIGFLILIYSITHPNIY